MTTCIIHQSLQSLPITILLPISSRLPSLTPPDCDGLVNSPTSTSISSIVLVAAIQTPTFYPGCLDTSKSILHRVPKQYRRKNLIRPSLLSVPLAKDKQFGSLPSPQMKTCWVTTGLSFLPMPVVVRSE